MADEVQDEVPQDAIEADQDTADPMVQAEEPPPAPEPAQTSGVKRSASATIHVTSG